MNNLNNYIQEKLKINSKSKVNQHKYNYHPEDGRELEDLLVKLLGERGSNADLNDIDVSKIEFMDYLFYSVNIAHKVGNINISEWDVSNVLSMEGMFMDCDFFNCDLSNWNVSKVNNMYCMFKNCEEFTAYGLDKWKLRKDCDTKQIFLHCTNVPDIKLNNCL